MDLREASRVLGLPQTHDQAWAGSREDSMARVTETFRERSPGEPGTDRDRDTDRHTRRHRDKDRESVGWGRPGRPREGEGAEGTGSSCKFWGR